MARSTAEAGAAKVRLRLMAPATEWIVLAQVLRPQGRKGEVLAELFTDFPERFSRQPRVWLAPAGFAESTGDGPAGSGAAESSLQQAEVVAHWLPTGRNAGRIVLHFAGMDSIERAELLAGKEVIVPLSERQPLDPGAAYVSDLIGSTVFDRGAPLGVIEAVEFPTSADGSRRLEEAAPLLAVLSPKGDEILIPFASAFLIRIDTEAKEVHMVLPEGLAEVNARAKAPDGSAAEMPRKTPGKMAGERAAES